MDMAYAMVNSNMQDIVSYMKDIVELSDKLGLKQAISDIKSIQSNLGLRQKDIIKHSLVQLFGAYPL